MNFDLGLVVQSVPQIAQGVGLTLQLLIFSIILGFILAVIAALMRISKIWFLVWPSFVYTYVFRGTPMLVQLFVIYYGLPQFEFVQDSVLWPVLREPYYCAILSFTLAAGAYGAEILRGGIQGVDRGLLEAGAALGLNAWHRFSRITTPIALRLSLPAFSNEIISLLKATALASTITMHDITGVARTIVAKTFAPYEIFLSAAIVYLALALVIQHGMARYERYLNRYLKT